MAAAAAATATGFTKKTRPLLQEPASTTRQIQSKSYSNPLSKSLIIVLILLVIPMSPSQAPDFISQSIVTEFWEIFHLLFIGIAVCYGLFSRKTAQTVTEKTVHSANDAYLSGISHLSSIFEDGFENSVGYELSDEQNVVKNYAVFSNVQVLGDEGKDGSRFLAQNDGTDNICLGNGGRVTQAWRSRYSKGESLVFVSNGKYFLDESKEIKPLNLPVRSLKSRVVDNVSKNRNESCSKFEGNDNDNAKVVKIRGVIPTNLVKKFEEVAGQPSIPWRSRSGRMEKGEEMGSLKPHGQFRPQSLGEFEFEVLKSRTFQDSTFSSSPETAFSKVGKGEEMSNPKPQGQFRPQSLGEFEFEHLKSWKFQDWTFSSSPEPAFSKVEKKERKMNLKQPNNPILPPKMRAMDTDASSNGVTRTFNIGASSELKRLNKFDYDLKKADDHGEEESIGKGKQTIQSFDSNTKSTTLAKVLSKAKSVRTIKPSRYTVDDKKELSHEIDGRIDRSTNAYEDDSLVRRGRGEEREDGIFRMPKPKPTLPELHNDGEKEYTDDESVSESEEDTVTGTEFDESSGKDDTGADSELEGSEVDRKAGEFIAKFREQIRLQKISSVKGHGGGW